MRIQRQLAGSTRNGAEMKESNLSLTEAAKQGIPEPISRNPAHTIDKRRKSQETRRKSHFNDFLTGLESPWKWVEPSKDMSIPFKFEDDIDWCLVSRGVDLDQFKEQCERIDNEDS